MMSCRGLSKTVLGTESVATRSGGIVALKYQIKFSSGQLPYNLPITKMSTLPLTQT